MRRVTIVVMGNGKTTRANVDALLDDMLDSVDEMRVAIVYDKEMNQELTWVQQYAADKSLPTVFYDRNDYRTLFSENNVEELKFFSLWDDDDPDSQLAASQAQSKNVSVYDLTNGLMAVSLSQSPIAKPEIASIPKVEEEISPIIELPEEAEEDDEELEDDEEGEYDLEETLTILVSELGKIFARSFADEFKRIIKE